MIIYLSHGQQLLVLFWILKGLTLSWWHCSILVVFLNRVLGSSYTPVLHMIITIINNRRKYSPVHHLFLQNSVPAQRSTLRPPPPGTAAPGRPPQGRAQRPPGWRSLRPGCPAARPGWRARTADYVAPRRKGDMNRKRRWPIFRSPKIFFNYSSIYFLTQQTLREVMTQWY